MISHRSLKRSITIIVPIIFFFCIIYSLGFPQKANALGGDQQEECKFISSTSTFELKKLHAKKYKVRVDAFKDGSMFRQHSSEKSIGGNDPKTTQIFLSNLFANIPSDFDKINLLVQVHQPQVWGKWDDLRNNGCNTNITIQNFEKSERSVFANYKWWPEITSTDNCVINFTGGIVKGLNVNKEVKPAYKMRTTNDSQVYVTLYKGIGAGESTTLVDLYQKGNMELGYDDELIRSLNSDVPIRRSVTVLYNGGSSFTTIDYMCNTDKFRAEPPPDVDPVDNSKSSPPPTFTCAEICQGETVNNKPGPQYQNCIRCVCADVTKPDSTNLSGNLWTEVGCITPTQNGVVASIMRIFFGIVTAFAIIQAIRGGMMINTDEPEKIKEGKSLFTSAIMAMAFGALIPIILNFIGIDVLGIGQIVNI